MGLNLQNLSHGRPKGAKNKTTRLLKEAIILAAEAHGSDGEGKEKLIGYIKFLAKDHVPVFGTLLGRLLPMQVNAKTEGPIPVIIEDMTAQEAAEIYRQALRVVYDPDKTIEGEALKPMEQEVDDLSEERAP